MINAIHVEKLLLPWLELKLKLIIHSCRTTLTLIMQLLNAHKNDSINLLFSQMLIVNACEKRQSNVMLRELCNAVHRLKDEIGRVKVCEC